MNLFKVIVYLDQQISETFNQAFEKELFNLQAPDVVMDGLLEKIHSEMDSQVIFPENFHLKRFVNCFFF